MSELWHATFRELISSGLLEIGDGYRAKNEELGGTGEIFLRAGHVRDSHIDLEGVERFHSHLSARFSGKMSQPGDTIITTKGNSIGRASYVSGNLPSFVYSPHLCYWRSRSPEKLSPGFLRFWARSPEFLRQLRGMQASTDMAPYLSLTDQSRLRIALPTVTHQRAVAAVLGALDDKIDLNRRTNETLEAMARALFKSWFVDFDPVHAKAAGRPPFGMDEAIAALFPDTFQHSAQGRIPRDWKVQSISEIQDAPRGTAAGPFGSNLTRSDYVGAGVPVIRGESMTGNEPWLNDSTFVFVTAEKAEELASNTARPGDLVFTQRGTLGQVAVIPPNSAFPIYVLSQSQMRLRSALSPLFLYFHFSSVETIEHILANSTAAGVPHINLGFLRQMTLCPFAPGVVAAFDASASSWMAKHLRNSRQSRTLAGLRDALLPKLLSGELRIKDAEKLVGEAT